MNAIQRALFTQPTAPWSVSRYIISTLLVALLAGQLWLLFSEPQGQHYRHLGSLLIVIAILASHVTAQYPMKRPVFMAIRVLGYVIIVFLALCFSVMVYAWFSR